ncbi:PQQ-binding-like beta-propeller repeat protein, partial [uncultured Methanobrevibacter sp.]|uniref:outer membrane protein assembly factor BamB family protein n=1 Tax=uncultured Methanobrevibacter sp. TaxID=253161 RepID=UPI00263250DA
LGQVIWRFGTTSRIICTPTIGSDGNFYFSNWMNSSVYCISPEGELIWKYNLGDYNTGSSPVFGLDNRLYVITSNDMYSNVYVFKDGVLLGNHTIPFVSGSSPVVGNDGRLYLISAGRELVCLNYDGSLNHYSLIDSGLFVWAIPTFSNRNYYQQNTQMSVSMNDGVLYVINYQKQLTPFLTAFYLNGTVKWSTLYPGYFKDLSGTPTYYKGVLYVTGNSDLFAFNASDGRILWSIPISHSGFTASSPLVSDDEVLYVTSNNMVYAFSLAGDLIWQYELPGNDYGSPISFSSPVLTAEGTLIVTTNQGIYAFRDVAADFTYEHVNGTEATIQFIDKSTNGSNRYYWMFGDGNVSREQNPVHEYASGGKYNVVLLVEHNGNIDLMRNKTIDVVFYDITPPSDVLAYIDGLVTEGGVFNQTQRVSLNATDEYGDVLIYYTVDGSSPLNSSTCRVYAGPFDVEVDTTLSMVACDDSGNWGNVSQIIFKITDVINIHDLINNITNNGSDVNGTGQDNASVDVPVVEPGVNGTGNSTDSDINGTGDIINPSVNGTDSDFNGTGDVIGPGANGTDLDLNGSDNLTNPDVNGTDSDINGTGDLVDSVVDSGLINAIQALLDGAEPYSKVLFDFGSIYGANFTINKPLNIISNNNTKLIGVDGNPSIRFAKGSEGSVLNGFEIINAGGDGVLIEADDILIRNCLVNVSNGTGINIYRSNGTSIMDTVVYNADEGILVNQSTNTLIDGVSVRDCYSDGIWVYQSMHTVIVNSLIEDNGKDPYKLLYGENEIVPSQGYGLNFKVNVPASESRANNILIDDSTDNYIYNNTINYGYFGIHLYHTTEDTVIDANKIYETVGDAILLGKQYYNVNITHNLIDGCYNGIDFMGYSENVLIKQNTIKLLHDHEGDLFSFGGPSLVEQLAGYVYEEYFPSDMFFNHQSNGIQVSYPASNFHEGNTVIIDNVVIRLSHRSWEARKYCGYIDAGCDGYGYNLMDGSSSYSLTDFGGATSYHEGKVDLVIDRIGDATFRLRLINRLDNHYLSEIPEFDVIFTTGGFNRTVKFVNDSAVAEFDVAMAVSDIEAIISGEIRKSAHFDIQITEGYNSSNRAFDPGFEKGEAYDNPDPVIPKIPPEYDFNPVVPIVPVVPDVSGYGNGSGDGQGSGNGSGTGIGDGNGSSGNFGDGNTSSFGSNETSSSPESDNGDPLADEFDDSVEPAEEVDDFSSDPVVVEDVSFTGSGDVVVENSVVDEDLTSDVGESSVSEAAVSESVVGDDSSSESASMDSATAGGSDAGNGETIQAYEVKKQIDISESNIELKLIIAILVILLFLLGLRRKDDEEEE